MSGIKYFESTSSTNDIAAEWAGKDAGDLSLVVANEQTHGRGRYGHTWFTYPETSLAFSLVLNPNEEEISRSKSSIHRFIGLGALGVCFVLEKFYSLVPLIKWPNDLYLQNKKVSGVLVEAQWLGENLKSIIIGIGINISPQSIPKNVRLRSPATSLETETGFPIDKLLLLRQLLIEIINWRLKIYSEEFIRSWESHLVFLGMPVRCKWRGTHDGLEGSSAVGRLIGLNDDGAIRLETIDRNEIILQEEIISLEPTDG